MTKILFFTFLLLSNSLYAKKAKSKGNSFNPAVGINLLFLNQNSDRDQAEDGLKLQEAELQFSSDVDTYFTAMAFFAIAEENGSYGIEPEETYIETISLPYVTMRIGKSKMPIGKHNELHSHAFPFINAPLVNEAILGDEGLNETGIGASALIPAPWFSEMTLHYTQGENENLFGSSRKDNKAVIGRFKNLWDLSDSATIEFGLSAGKGKNINFLSSAVYGADLTFKWRPTTQGKYRSIEWGSEFLAKDNKGMSDGKLSGFVTHFKYQLAERWYAQYRYDYLGLNKSRTIDPSKRHTGLIAFLPSEFSGIRFQYENINDGQMKSEKRLSLQLNISIGAHPAHTY